MPKFYIWLDDERPFPYYDAVPRSAVAVVKSVNHAKQTINDIESKVKDASFILDLDHDLGEFASDGGDGYELIVWLIESGRNYDDYKVKVHTMNPVGRERMEGLVDRYWVHKKEDLPYYKLSEIRSLVKKSEQEFDMKFDAVMSFVSAYEVELDIAERCKDNSILSAIASLDYVFGILSGGDQSDEAIRAQKHVIMAMYEIANYYNDFVSKKG